MERPSAASALLAINGPANQLAAPAIPTTLTDGSTYFVRLYVNGSASSYAIERTATAATGVFSMGDFHTRTAGSAWGTGSNASETMVGIVANPVPEPAVAVLGCAGFMLILRRRRW